MTKYAIRPGTNDDVPFMMRRTLKDLRNMDFTRSLSNDLYYTYMHRAFEHHMTKSLVRVAYPAPKSVAEGTRSGDSRKILGFLVCLPADIGLIVHYCNVRRSVDDETGFVTENHRKEGIARQMIESVIKDYDISDTKPITYTLRTAQFRYDKPFREYVDRSERFQYNPFLFFTLLPQHWETGIKRKPSEAPLEWSHVGQ